LISWVEERTEVSRSLGPFPKKCVDQETIVFCIVPRVKEMFVPVLIRYFNEFGGLVTHLFDVGVMNDVIRGIIFGRMRNNFCVLST